MRKNMFRKIAWLVVAVIVRLSAFGADVMYFEFDQVSSENKTYDSIGGSWHFKTANDYSPDPDQAAPTIPNPDSHIFTLTGSDGATVNDKSIDQPRFYQSTGAFQMNATASWTLEGWFQLDSQPSDSTWFWIAGTRNTGPHGDNYGWRLIITTDDKIRIQMYKEGGDPPYIQWPGTTALVSGASGNPDSWYHFALVYDHDRGGADGFVTCYLNGSVEFEGTGYGDLSTQTGSRYFSVGGHEASSNQEDYSSNGFDGRFDEFRYSPAPNFIDSPAQFLNYVGNAGTVIILR